MEYLLRGKMRQILLVTLLVFTILILVAGCDGDNKERQNAEEPATVDQKADLNTKVILDQNGREVEMKAVPARIITTALPLPAVYYLVTGSCQELVGIHPASMSAAETSVLSAMAPELMEAETGFIKGKEFNIEEMMKLAPDAVIFWGSYEEQQRLLENAGIPAVAVKGKDWDVLETLREWTRILGDMTGKQEAVGEIITYAEKTQQMIDTRLGTLEEKNKPRGMILFRHDNEEITVSGSEHYGQYWLESTGAVNVASELKAISAVNMEQIYTWNPEVIFISNFTEFQPEDLFNNTIKGQDWSKVKAVQEGRVYKIPLGIFRWYPPSGDAPLMLKWMAQKNHPAIFNDYDIKEEMKQYYQEFYNYNLTDDEIERILHPVRAGAKGATKWTGG